MKAPRWSILLIATLMLIFTLQAAIADPSTNPADYYFSDFMDHSDVVRARYVTTNALNYTTAITYEGHKTLSILSNAAFPQTNFINQTEFTSSEADSNFCIMITGQTDVVGQAANQEAGFVINSWTHALLFSGTLGAVTDLVYSDGTTQTKFGATFGADTWGNITACVNSTTVDLYRNNVYNTTVNAGTRTDWRKIIFDNRMGGTNNFTMARILIWNNTLYGPMGPQESSSVNIVTASLTNIVNGSNFGSVTFSNVTGSLTFNYFNITGTGFCVTYTGNGTGTNCTAGNGASTYFNVSNTTTITGSQSVTATTFQGLLQIQASKLFLNTSISTFNGTNNQATNTTSSGTLFLKALNGSNNVQVAVAGNYSKNVTCTVPAPLQTASCNATDIHDNFYAFNATDIWNDVPLLNFSLIVTNGTLGGVLYNQSTTNGSLNFILLQGYTYFIQFATPNGTHEYMNVSLAANASNQRYEFEVLPAPSIDITIRSASTGSLITENITIVLTSNTTGDTVYTVTGGYFATDLSPEQYVIKLSGANYSQSTYVVTAGEGSVYFLTAYLQANTSEVVMQFVDSIATSVTITGASVTQQALVNGSWVPISTKLTDITGRTTFGYLDDVAYQFIAIATGYQTKTFTLDPVLFSSYTVQMQRSTTLDFTEDFQSVYINYEPKLFYNARENEVDITFASPTGTFTSYDYTINYPGGTKTGGGSNVVGETFSVAFNITGASYLDRVNISLGYDTTIGPERSFNYSNLILISPGNTTFIANQDNTYGLGLVERLLVVTIIIVVVAGLATLFAGPIAGLVVALFLMGWAVKIGFWPWWAAGISFLLGLALVAGRTD